MTTSVLTPLGFVDSVSIQVLRTIEVSTIAQTRPWSRSSFTSRIEAPVRTGSDVPGVLSGGPSGQNRLKVSNVTMHPDCNADARTSAIARAPARPKV